jgi:hypothetical protein
MSSEWGGYDESAQRDIMAALGEQTRAAFTMLGDKFGAEIEMDWDSTARGVCSEALATGRELVRPEPGECSLQIQAYFRLGLTPVMIAEMGRQSADEPESSSRL